MTLQRSRAYGRAIRALESAVALAILTREQRDALRDAADTLVLARGCDHEARAALAAARAVLLGIPREKSEPWIEQLADDLQDAGPTSINVLATSAKASRARSGHSADRPLRR